MEYRREIDGLRALAVLPVVLFHAGFQVFSGGFIGVDVFFVISGYLITRILLAEQQEGKFSLLNFYERRARRILPALFFMVLVCLPAAWFWLLPSDLKDFSESVVSVFTFSSNLLFWRTSGYFDTDTEMKPLLHTWSLAVEEQYYLFFPVFIAIFWRFGRNFILALLLLVAVCSLAIAQWGSSNDPMAAFYLLPTRSWELLIGAFTAFFLLDDWSTKIGQTASNLGSGVGLILIAYAVLFYSKETPFPGVYALVPTVGAALIILFATPQTLVGGVLGSKLFVAVGLVSYSTYLWHQPLFAFARHGHPDEPGAVLMAALAAASVALGYLSWRFVERPFRSKRLMTRNAIFIFSGGLSAVFIMLGIAGTISTGFANRYAAEDRYLATLQKRVVGKYVSKRFNAYLMKPFDVADGRKRVLLIGDSFGQDLVNAVFEGGLDQQIQISTRHIGHECGNLFLPRAEFAAKISTGATRGCAGKGLHEDGNLRKLMLSADEIWFASRWQAWQVKLVQDSVASVQQLTAKPVKVFGRKDFGNVQIKALLFAGDPARRVLRSAVASETIEVNTQFKVTLPPDVFIDIQQLLCGDDVGYCRLYADGAGLISYDGGHLTEFGARYLGLQLAKLGSLQHVSPQLSAHGDLPAVMR